MKGIKSAILAIFQKSTNGLNWLCPVKAELPQEGILFRTQFPSLGFFINKIWISKKPGIQLLKLI
jgi:hypothetical protein